jgi:predicted DNA-binding transcriptional regulator YafY
MNRTDRMTGILLALRGGQQTSAQLADRFEVSRRTILRDLAALGELGVPVIAVSGTGGGFALPMGYWLPPLKLSAAEATAVLLGLAALGPAAGSPFGEPRRTAEEKIRALIDADTLRASDAALRHVTFDPRLTTPDAADVQAIQDAIATGQWLRIVYRSVRRSADHEVLPVRLMTSEGRWYVDAISREARARRRYRLDRIDALRRIPAPPDADAIREEAAAVTPYDHADHPEVTLHLTGAGLVRAPDLLGVRLAPVPHDAGWWEIRFRCPESELPFFARCVLVLGDDCRAIGPPDLVEIVRQVARTTLERYAPRRP